MVKSNDSGFLSISPFLKKCYDMVDDESTDSIISWSRDDNSFVIWNVTEFTVHLLPKYFKHNNFSSFVRQLNIYGFRKIDADYCEFANDGFIRGQKQLLTNISRRKHPQIPDQSKTLQPHENSVEACESAKMAGLQKEVENLKTGRNALMQELVKLRQHQETADNKLILLSKRLQGMENNQQQMLSFLVMAMQSPGVFLQLLHPKENNWRTAEAGCMLAQVTEDVEPIAQEGMVIRYQPLPIDGTPEPALTPVLGSENPPNCDSSDAMKDFLRNSDFMKVLMDDTYVPFSPLDLQDVTAWEKLLLASPISEHTEDAKLNKEGLTDAKMETESTVSETAVGKSQNFEILLEEMGKSPDFENELAVNKFTLKNSKNVEILTEHLGDLNTDGNHRGRTL